jgi:NIMA (never in mitosis gene a)-related kinase
MEITTTLKDFEVLNKLGEGAFGQVFKVKRKIDGQLYAMKKVPIYFIPD